MPGIQDLKHPADLSQTWEDVYKNINKTEAAIKGTNEQFAEFVANAEDFSEFTQEQFRDYLDSFDDVSKHWEEINDWIKEHKNLLDYEVKSLSDIRGIFNDIANISNRDRRQVLERTRIARNLVSAVNDRLILAQQEGGYTEKDLVRLQKKTALYNIQAKFQEDIAKKQLEALAPGRQIVDAQAEAEEQLRRTQDQIAAILDLRKQGERINYGELKALKEKEEMLSSILEYTSKTNREARESLSLINEQTLKELRVQRRGGAAADENSFGEARVNLGAGLLRKAGMGSLADEILRSYGRWTTDRTEAKVKLKIAKENQVIAQTRVDEETQKLGGIDVVGAKSKELEVLQEQARNFKEELRKAKEDLDQIKSSSSILHLQPGAVEEATKKYKKAKNNFDETQKKALDLRTELGDLIAANVQLQNANAEVKGLQKAKDKIFNIKFGENLKGIALGLKDLLNPANILTGLLLGAVSSFLSINGETANVKRLVGEWTMGLAGAHTGVASIQETTKLIGDLTREISLNPISIFTDEELGKMADAQKLLGLSATQAAGLGVQSKLNAQSSDEYRKALTRGINAGQTLHRTIVAHGVATREALEASDAIKISMGNNAEAIGKAVVAAKSLGMNLKDVESISRNLIDFQSSIESEMQAQLLTGHQLNLARARELALNNDLEGVVREIGNQGITMSEYGHMNLIQQENMAKALGMSRDQMAKMLVTQALSEGLTAKQIADVGLMNEKQIEAMSLQESWKAAMERLMGVFLPVFQLLLPFAELVARIISPIAGLVNWLLEPLDKFATWLSKVFAYISEGAAWLRKTLGIESEISDTAKTVIGAVETIAIVTGIVLFNSARIAGHFGGLLKSAKNVAVAIGGWVKNLFRARTEAAVFDEVANRWRDPKTGRFVKNPNIAKKAATAAKAQGPSQVGQSVGNLGKNMKNIALGAAAAVLLATAVFILAKACQEFAKIDNFGQAILGAGLALAALTGAVIVLGRTSTRFSKDILLGVAAVSLIAGATWIFGKALQQFEDIKPGLVLAVAGSMVGLAIAVSIVGAAASAAGPVILLGIVAIAGMAGAVALLGVALKTLDGINWEGFKGIGKAMWSLASAGIAAMVAGPALMVGAIKLIPGAYALAQAFKVLATAEDVNTANILQTIKDLKGIEIPEVSNFQRLQKIAQVLVRTSRRLRNASFKPLENLSNLGTGLSSTANALVRVGEAIGLVATNLNRLDSEKLTNLRSKSFAGILARLQRRSERSVNLGEIAESPKETLTEANKELTIKKAEQVSTNQRISIEQKATDLRAIEQKIDKVVAAIGNSRPDWDWVKFEQARGRNLSWISG